jgi:hypothetical protein
MNLLPSQWIVIGSQVVNLAIVILGAIDLNYHMHLLTNPLTLTIMTILSGVGIHQTINPTLPKKQV